MNNLFSLVAINTKTGRETAFIKDLTEQNAAWVKSTFVSHDPSRIEMRPVGSVAEEIHVGDTVIWRGDFGNAPPISAKVASIELCEMVHGKHGKSVPFVTTDLLDRTVFVLTNRRWAYGDQISPVHSVWS
jgi:hypothetical protein